jgi:tRNA-splicing ligase RtcB
MYTLTTERTPLFIWGEAIDEATLVQARNLANLPFTFHHVALMPDAHVGYGMPIGGVFAALGQVVPHAVGLDIGCGVRGWKTNVPTEEFLPVRDAILNDIQRSVPQGFEWHKASQAERTPLFDDVPDVPALKAEIIKAERQVGRSAAGTTSSRCRSTPTGSCGRWCTPDRATSASRLPITSTMSPGT